MVMCDVWLDVYDKNSRLSRGAERREEQRTNFVPEDAVEPHTVFIHFFPAQSPGQKPAQKSGEQSVTLRSCQESYPGKCYFLSYLSTVLLGNLHVCFGPQQQVLKGVRKQSKRDCI